MKWIAQQCPFEFGEMVYLSRIMLKMNGDTTEYFNECEFDEAEIPCKNAVFGNNDDAFTTVYPNPANNEIQIMVESNLEESVYSYQLFDLEGRELTEVRQGTYNNAAQMDVSSLKEGIYFLSITTLEGNSMHKRISIVR